MNYNTKNIIIVAGAIVVFLLLILVLLFGRDGEDTLKNDQIQNLDISQRTNEKEIENSDNGEYTLYQDDSGRNRLVIDPKTEKSIDQIFDELEIKQDDTEIYIPKDNTDYTQIDRELGEEYAEQAGYQE